MGNIIEQPVNLSGSLSQDIRASHVSMLSPGGLTLESRRKKWIDVLRMVSAFGIVWFHANAPGADIGYSGLSFFIMITMTFQIANTCNLKRNILRGADHILLPWAFWMIFYGSERVLIGKPFFLADVPICVALLDGTSTHLWYLPFIFFVSTSLRIVQRTPLKSAMVVISATALVIALLTVNAWWPAAMTIGPPISRYAQATPAVLFGILLGGAKRSRLFQPLVFLAIIGFGISAATSTANVGLGDGVAGIALGCALLLDRTRAQSKFNTTEFAEWAYGIYLMHPFFMSLAKALFATERAATAIVAYFGAWMATIALRKYGGAFGRAIT